MPRLLPIALSLSVLIAATWLPMAAMADDAATKPLGMAELLAASKPDAWRTPDPEQTLYLDLPAGRVIIELAPDFAPAHVANIQTLAKAHYFDGLSVLRVQENYVAQWGDPNAEDTAKRKALGDAKPNLAGEFQRQRSAELPVAKLPDGDVYAEFAGVSKGFPVAGKGDQIWLAHCYGMVGAGRGDTADSGNGAELYVVIGHSPRHLDRNVTLVGRVLLGMEHLTTLQRGTGALGFIEPPAPMTRITSIRLAADTPKAERTAIEVLRTDTPLFKQLIEARRTRRESWFLEPTGRIELCNVPIPVRLKP
ncbi:peptidylprolyl isomerase [Ahniella affigens]|uniref:peptidylprolyl isomerase n=1 Tax=Ahniella affigens TaxID=2021234 RepID=A0A2P1PR84_9GAMM|nr:peptidylprolyl isomerase [Ahniella affigens]AVP97366.1 peptidylprolyl isomerase [Ahniella affigens]